jgi:hypothetical protein
VHDSGFVLVEDQPAGCQPFGQAGFDLFGLPLGVAERDQIVSISDHHRGARLGVAGLTADGDVADSRGVFQPVQRDVQEQGTNHAPLWSSLLGRGEPFPPLEHPGGEPIPNHVPDWE